MEQKKVRELCKAIIGRAMSMNKSVLFMALSLPVVLFVLPLLLTGTRLAGGDADYLMQTQEAARISILQYNQFPWWNPWVSGGIPLFANPQFGLLSIPTFLTMIFGSVLGYKIALLVYFLIGFWGFLLLFRRSFSTPELTSILLAYIWTFGSFLVHRSGGHYTFFTIQFFPITLYLFLNRKTIKRSWLWLGLTLSLMANTATHNMTVLSFTVLGLLILLKIFTFSWTLAKRHVLKTECVVNIQDLTFLLKVTAIFLATAGYKIYFALDYLAAYPRELVTPETSSGILKGIYALFGPLQFEGSPSLPTWSWQEASAYIGISTGVVAILCAILYLGEYRSGVYKEHRYTISPLIIATLGLIFFLLGLGIFIGELSPYYFLKSLPVFSDMRVATRWFVWTAIMILLFIGLYSGKKWRRAIDILLLISVLELFISSQRYIAKPYIIQPTQYSANSVINQQAEYDNKRAGIPYDENLTTTTQANIGQTIAGDALIDTRFPPPWGTKTARCDSDAQECSFVLTKNAEVTYWSPNRIDLVRKSPGLIELNMNPGKHWVVNNRFLFSDMRHSETEKPFLITDESKNITVRLLPRYSPEWFWFKLLEN